MKYRVISSDDHLQEAPHTWTSRMSAAKWGSKIPQIRELEDRDAWFVYDEPSKASSVALVNGACEDRAKPITRWEEVPDIAYKPDKRVEAMLSDGVDCHTLFGNIAGVAGAAFSNPKYEEGFRIEAIQAFNDFQLEEYGAAHPGRYITLAIVPLWSPEAAVAEVVRCQAKGTKGISFAFPQQFGYPHFADHIWDPFWRVCEEANLSVNMHIGSGGSMGIQQDGAFDGNGLLRWRAETATRAITANTMVMSTVLFSGVLERFPNIKIVSSESGIGWVPYLLDTADHEWETKKMWREGMELKPSDYFHRNVYVNFWYERVNTDQKDRIGVDNMMWESDYPHPTCSWPDSKGSIEYCLDGLTDAEKHKILVSTPAKVFNLDAE